MITAKLINIGRNDVCKTITVETMDDVYDEVRRHLLSRDVGMYAMDDDGTKWQVLAGMRQVGTVEVLSK